MTRLIRAARGPAVAAWVLAAGLAGASVGGDSLDVQGHRGWRGHYPENTMAAFRAALELRVTTLEFDIQVTRDGVPVVHHDPRLENSRCVRDDGSRVEQLRLSQLEFTELADIDCGSRVNGKFPEQRAVPGERIPRLDQVLDLVRQADYPVGVSIEIKMQDTKSDRSAEELAGIVIEAVRAHGLEERTIIQSFQPEALAAVAALAPELGRAILVRSPGAYDRAVERSQATILSPRHDGLTQAAVERFQQRDIAVVPWTVNKPNVIERMISWGVDGIISDYPDRVLQILDRSPEDAP
jgi:glycerophosphoryl diester phosphodiesterase